MNNAIKIKNLVEELVPVRLAGVSFMSSIDGSLMMFQLKAKKCAFITVKNNQLKTELVDENGNSVQTFDTELNGSVQESAETILGMVQATQILTII